MGSATSGKRVRIHWATLQLSPALVDYVLVHELARLREPQGLTRIGARNYDPGLGTFISLDPLLETTDPAQLNGYTYSGDNPITGSDPTGMCRDPYDPGTPCGDGSPDPNPDRPCGKTCESPAGSSESSTAGGGPSPNPRPGRATPTVALPTPSPSPGPAPIPIECLAAATGSNTTCNAFIDFLLQISGATDAESCMTGSVSGCAWTALNVIPLGHAAEGGEDAVRAAVAAVRGASDAREIGRIIWSLPADIRGEVIEEILGRNTPNNFRVFDRWDATTEIATSIKSIDTTAKSYQKYGQVNGVLRRFIREVAEFQSDSRGGLDLDSSMIKTRRLDVAIPPVALSANQYKALTSAYQYALSKNVQITFIVAG